MHERVRHAIRRAAGVKVSVWAVSELHTEEAAGAGEQIKTKGLPARGKRYRTLLPPG